MKIKKFRVRNYKSVADSGWLDLGERFTVVVGKNNVGKTALLEAFRGNGTPSRPHKSLKKRVDEALDQQSVFQFQVTPEGSELRDSLSAMTGTINIPSRVAKNADQKMNFLERFLSGDGVRFDVTAVGGAGLSIEGYPSHHMFEEDTAPQYLRISEKKVGKPLPPLEGPSGGRSDSAGNIFLNYFPKKVYVFNAERMNISEGAFHEARVLESNARNLPQVLATLQGENRALFARFSAHIAEVFPNVREISVFAKDANVEVRLWNVDPETGRTDLANGLAQSGTGVSQVMAILYVAMTMRGAVIVIDEPNSFLHPGASKALIQILSTYDNQYVISTHSTELVAAAQPEQVLSVRWEDGDTKVQQLDGASAARSREVLADLGVTPADVFGIDRAIWVEGPTEASCFPLIARAELGALPRGVAFIAVRSVDEIVRRTTVEAAIVDIYKRLSAANPLMPAAVRFSFDRETRSPDRLAKLEAESKGLVTFLPAYCYETCLIHLPAIIEVMNAEADRVGVPRASQANVEATLDEHAGNWRSQDAKWRTEYDGALILQKLFTTLLKIEYRKTFHSVALTRWLLESAPEHLDELRTYVVSLLPKDA